jgi:uncharacterized membrane protein HdeD (DUF308 family)
MTFDLSLITAIIAIVFGIIVLAKPAVLAYLIGIYLIIIGAIYLIPRFM